MSFRLIPDNPTSGLVEVAPNIWTIEAKECVCYRPPMQPRYPYTHRAIVIRLNDNSLFIISPIRLTPALRAEIDILGTVQYIVSPNHLHHLHMRDWKQVYPDAKLYASPRLPGKRKDLIFDKTLSTDTPEPEWAGQIEQCVFGTGNGWFDELVFFHLASGTVIFTDLIMDFNPATFSSLAQVTTRWNQMYQHTPRGVQLAHTLNRSALRNALQRIRAWEPERAIVAHSPWLCVESKQQVAALLNSAFDWLAPKLAIVESVMTVAQFLILFLIVLPIHALIVLIADIITPKLMNRSESQ